MRPSLISEITFDEIETLYEQGEREFHNKCLLFCFQSMCAQLSELPGAQFQDCTIKNIRPGLKIQIENIHSGTIIELSTNDYLNFDNELINSSEIFNLISGNNDFDFETKNATCRLNSKKLCALLLDENKNLKKDIVIFNAVVTDLFDLSGYSVGDKVEDQEACVDTLLSMAFECCSFSRGIKLPDFILNQCENKFHIQKKLMEKRVSWKLLIDVLVEAKTNFKKLKIQHVASKKELKKRKNKKYLYQEEFKRALEGRGNNAPLENTRLAGLNSTVLSAETFLRLVNDNQFTNFRGCTVTDLVDFSAVKLKHRALDIQNTSFLEGIIIDSKTDFRQYSSAVQWPDTMLLIYRYRINNQDYELKTTVAELYGKLKFKAAMLRGKDWLPNIFQSNFFDKLEKKYAGPGLIGQKLFETLRHIQKQEHAAGHGVREFLGIRSRRTHSALQSLLKEFGKPVITTEAEEPVSPVSAFIPIPVAAVETEVFSFSATPQAQSSEAITRDVSPAPVLVDEKSVKEKIKAERVAKARITLMDALSSFKSADLLGRDQDTEDDCLRRKIYEDEIVASYHFLKSVLGKAGVREFDEKLKYVIYPNYLQYVALGKRAENDTGEQNKWLRYNMIESLYKASDVIPHSASLKMLSDHRGELVSGSQFFKSDSPLGLQFRMHCQTEWAKTPLEILKKAGCFDNDGVFIKNNIFFDAVIAAEKKMQNRHEIDEERVKLEKQYVVAELIKLGDFKTANAILNACRVAWPSLSVDSEIGNAMQFLITAALKEAKKSGESEGREYRKLYDFSKSELAKNKLLENNPLILEISTLSTLIPHSVAATNVFLRIAHQLSYDANMRISDRDLQIVETCASYKNIKWIGMLTPSWIASLERSKNKAAYDSSKKGVIEKLLLLLKSINKSKDHFSEFNQFGELSHFIETVYQVRAAKKGIADALADIWEQKAVKWAMQNGALQELPQEGTGEVMGMPADARAYKNIMRMTEKSLREDSKININYYKYMLAVKVQNELQQFCNCAPSKIPEKFSKIKQLLQDICDDMADHEEGDGKFANCIYAALNKVIAEEIKWRENVLETVYSLPPIKNPLSRTAKKIAVEFESF